MASWLVTVAMAVAMMAVVAVACPPRYGNCDVFPYDDEFNRDISSYPVDYTSPCMMNIIGTNYDTRAYTRNAVHLDWGSDLNDGYGIPFSLATNSDPMVSVTFGKPSCNCNYGSESDPGPYRVANTATIEGSTGANGNMPPSACSGDNHLVSLDQDNCILYETYSTVFQNGQNPSGGLYACSAAKFDLKQKLPQRPQGWTSADAAGLPIWPGLAKYDEAISANGITHATRFTLRLAQASWTKPASHAGPHQNVSYPVYGSRWRLKPSIDENLYTDPAAKALVVAWKKYGLIFADQGSNMYVSGTSDSRWATAIDQINSQHKIYHDDFEVVINAYPITQDGWSSPPLTCNGVSSNPAFTPPTIQPCGSTSSPTASTSAAVTSASSSSPAASSSSSTSSTPAATSSASATASGSGLSVTASSSTNAPATSGANGAVASWAMLAVAVIALVM